MHPPPPIPCDPRGRRRCVGEAAGPGPAPAGTDAGGHGHGGTQADTGRRRGPQGSTPQAGLPGPPSLPPAEVGWLEAAGDVLPWPAESGTGRWRIKVTAIVSETHQVSGISAGASLALLLKVKIFTQFQRLSASAFRANSTSPAPCVSLASECLGNRGLSIYQNRHPNLASSKLLSWRRRIPTWSSALNFIT